jgi:hypothetical protein
MLDIKKYDFSLIRSVLIDYRSANSSDRLEHKQSHSDWDNGSKQTSGLCLQTHQKASQDSPTT